MNEATEYWIYTRSETRELLRNLTDEQLLFKPEGPKWQPLHHQFTCMIRVQLAYAKALRTGEMDFAYFREESLPGRHSLKTREQLDAAFDNIREVWKAAIATGKDVRWLDQDVSAAGHIYRLVAHERLHHGQIISYCTMAGYDLPASFKESWSL